MSLKDQLKEDMKAAMKAREEGKTALSVIRMVNSAIKNTEINDKIELDDAGILGILAKEMKTRQDSLTEFEKAGRWQFSQRPAFVTFLGIIIILQFFSYRMSSSYTVEGLIYSLANLRNLPNNNLFFVFLPV